MKQALSYISAALLGVVALSSCNDNFERPPMIYPTSDVEANTTIEQLKTLYWSTERNYVNTCGTLEQLTGNADDADKHIYIAGRVVSESESGNIYNSIVLQDETGAINVAVRTNTLEKSYLFGQEVVVDVTNLKIGGYNSLMQLGDEGVYNGAPSMTFMEGTLFEEHAQINGAPQTALVDTMVVTIEEIEAAKADANGLIKYQSRLVRLNDLTFLDAGKPLAESATTDRYAKDASGKQINVRTSAYASFKNDLLPSGAGSVVGILSYYGTGWQLLLNDITGLIGFEESGDQPGGDEPTPPTPGEGGDGSAENPYTVAQVVAGASGSEVWTMGYIVGWVDGMTLSEGANFNANATSQTNILIAGAADESDYTNCVPVQLPSGAVRSGLNLQTNPGNLGKQVWIKGNLETYFGTKGIKSATEFKLEGGDDPEPPTTDPVASLTQDFESGIPSNWTQVQVAGNKTWYTPSFQNNYYAAMTGYNGTAPFDQWLITPAIDMNAATDKVLSFVTEVNGYGSTTSVFEVYVLTSTDLATATKNKLNPTLATAPESGYSDWVNSGELDLSSFSGVVYIGFRYYATADSNYATWCLDNVKVNVK